MKKFNLPKLPYGQTDLKGLVSAETFEYHLGKHHKAYIDKMNTMLETDKSFGENPTLEDLVRKTQGGLFNQAGQSWNHTFYWYSMTPTAKTLSGNLKTSLEGKFGSLEKFKTEFVEKGVGLFGSGWVWLVKNSAGGLELVNTSNAENPIRQGAQPVFVCDVWEHAYYIDFRNGRKGYLEKFFDHIDWTFAAANFESKTVPNMTQYMV